MGLLKVNPTGLQNHMFWGLVFQVQDPRTGELGGGSDHLFFGEDLCDCNYFLLCESLLDGSVGTEPACQSGRHRRRGFQLWAGENTGGGSATSSNILAGKFYGQKSLAGHSPWGHNTTAYVVYTHTHLPGIWVLIIPCLCPSFLSHCGSFFISLIVCSFSC